MIKMFWNKNMDEKELKLIRNFYRKELYKLQKVLVKKKKKKEKLLAKKTANTIGFTSLEQTLIKVIIIA